MASGSKIVQKQVIGYVICSHLVVAENPSMPVQVGRLQVAVLRGRISLLPPLYTVS